MTTWGNSTKHSSSTLSPTKSGILIYLVTDTPDFVLVGQNSDEVLIAQAETAYTGPSKHSASYASPIKH